MVLVHNCVFNSYGYANVYCAQINCVDVWDPFSHTWPWGCPPIHIISYSLSMIRWGLSVNREMWSMFCCTSPCCSWQSGRGRWKQWRNIPKFTSTILGLIIVQEYERSSGIEVHIDIFFTKKLCRTRTYRSYWTESTLQQMAMWIAFIVLRDGQCSFVYSVALSSKHWMLIVHYKATWASGVFVRTGWGR